MAPYRTGRVVLINSNSDGFVTDGRSMSTPLRPDRDGVPATYVSLGSGARLEADVDRSPSSSKQLLVPPDDRHRPVRVPPNGEAHRSRVPARTYAGRSGNGRIDNAVASVLVGITGMGRPAITVVEQRPDRDHHEQPSGDGYSHAQYRPHVCRPFAHACRCYSPTYHGDLAGHHRRARGHTTRVPGSADGAPIETGLGYR